MRSDVKKQNVRPKKTIAYIGFALLILIQIIIIIYFGNRKAGFHEDEFYSFYSSNKTAGLFVNDREWIEGNQLRNEFVVLPGETFRYEIVAMMQSWDVHPPLYYFLLHTVCSVFTGTFSKWLGIGINLVAFALNLLLLYYLAGKVCGKHKRLIAWVVCALWGLTPASVSGVMFIRMYEWLTVFVLLCACIHTRAVEWLTASYEDKSGGDPEKMKVGGFYLSLAVTVYLGFLTQYYYIIFHFFIGVGFCIWMLFHDPAKRKMGFLLCMKYGAACAIGLGAALLSYPVSLSHIFVGYRGAEAVSAFGTLSNTGERLRFFFGLLNDYVFGGILIVPLVIAVIFVVRFKLYGNAAYRMLLFACIGYFFTVSKTALLLGATSNRYQLPIYGIVVLLLVIPLCEVAAEKRENSQYIRFLPVICILSLAVFNGLGLFWHSRVLFLYEEQASVVAYAKENKTSDVILFYNEASTDNIWRLSDELMEYDRIYLLGGANRQPIMDDTIRSSDKLVVYVADQDNAEQCSQMILEANPGLTERKLIARKELWTIYEFT